MLLFTSSASKPLDNLIKGCLWDFSLNLSNISYFSILSFPIVTYLGSAPYLFPVGRVLGYNKVSVLAESYFEIKLLKVKV